LEYVNLDAPENRDVLHRIPSATWAENIGNAIIDESQKLPEIFEKVKYAFDEKKITFTCLTGSRSITPINY
jgi:predicted AAA+ superfamily ATPase